MTTGAPIQRAYVPPKERAAEIYVELAQVYAMARDMRWDANNRLLTGLHLQDVDAACDSIKEAMQGLEYIASGSPPIGDSQKSKP